MPHSYFEPEGLDALRRVYEQAVAEIARFQPVTDDMANVIAARIFALAAKGYHTEAYMLQHAIDGFTPKLIEIEGSGSGE